MSGNANSGRRPSPLVNLENLKELSLAQVMRLLRQQGRKPMGRAKLRQEIALGKLQAYLDTQRLSNKGEPTYVIKRQDYNRWVDSRLRRLSIPISA